MKTLVAIIIAGFLMNVTAFGQRMEKLQDIKPGGDFENILAHKLDSDERLSTFIIWVKKDVPAHRHTSHSEVVYVLEGTGEMMLGDDVVKLAAGDYIFIPKGTVHAVRVKTGPLKVMSIQSPEFDGSDRVPVSLDW